MPFHANVSVIASLLVLIVCPLESGRCEAPTPASPNNSVGPYCGIDCVYAAARHYDRPVSYATLVDPRFVGSFRGSSLAELVAAAESVGLAASPRSGLTLSDLQSLGQPTILLLSRDRHAAAFHHWVLVLHAGPERIRLLEMPGLEEEITYAQLLAQWEGVGLVVYPDAAARAAAEHHARTGSWLTAALLGLAAVGAYFGRRVLPRRLTTPDSRLRAVVIPALGIVFCAAAAALAWHASAGTGFFRNAEAVAIVKGRFIARQLPRVTRQEVAELVAQQGAIVIDARFPDDYARGHIPSAINVPIHVTPTAIQEFARGLPKGKPVVVYCLSDKCEYDEEIGSQLALAGIKEVSLYQAGWRDWRAAVSSATSSQGHRHPENDR